MGCGFDPGRCTKNASLEKIYLLGRMNFSRESWILHVRTLFDSVPVQEVPLHREEWTCDRLREGLDSFTE
jgi:hypothetical protein